MILFGVIEFNIVRDVQIVLLNIEESFVGFGFCYVRCIKKYITSYTKMICNHIKEIKMLFKIFYNKVHIFSYANVEFEVSLFFFL